MNGECVRLSIVIPVAPNEDLGPELLTSDLSALRASHEILLVGPELPTALVAWLSANGQRARHVASALGRASQLNAGARAATGTMVLFLHFDSRLPEASILRLEAALDDADAETSLRFFDLKFSSDRLPALRLNELGARLRSDCFKMPFGDQGFLIARSEFDRLGGFDEQVAFGEDHVLTWTARFRGVSIRSLGAPIVTSARKYERGGWARTTLRHLVLTYAQAGHCLMKEWRASWNATRRP